MPFKDWSEVYVPLVLRMGGKEYTIRPLNVPDGLLIMKHTKPDAKTEPMPDEKFCRIMLGPALDEMKADGVSFSAMKRAALTALAEFQAGRAVAEVLWETGGDPLMMDDAIKRQIPKA